MKNLDLGKKLTRDEQKMIQGAGWYYVCNGNFKYFSSMTDCLNYGNTWCFSGNYSCSNGEQNQ